MMNTHTNYPVPCCEDCSKDLPNLCDCVHCVGPEAAGWHEAYTYTYEPHYDAYGNELVSEDYLATYLPDGWHYDCWIDGGIQESDPWYNVSWHFTIYAPGDPEPYHLAFQSIAPDGTCVWAD